MTRVPLPPADAQTYNTVCQFCIVGCGYKVFKWPQGKEGGPAPSDNALAADLREPQGPDGDWISPNMHSVVREKSGTFNVAIVPDRDCVVNSGMASVRGGGMAQTLYSPERPTKARLIKPQLRHQRGSFSDASWDDAVDLGAQIIKAVIDRWGPNAVGMKFFDHGGGGGGFPTSRQGNLYPIHTKAEPCFTAVSSNTIENCLLYRSCLNRCFSTSNLAY